MSRFVLGTVQFGTFYGINSAARPSEKEVSGILDLAYDNGITVLDTASVYGEAEKIIGKYLGQSKTSFRVNSKFSLAAGATISKSFNESIATLGVHQLQAYFFHRFEDVADATAMQTLLALKASGQISSIGVSVYTNEQFKAGIDLAEIDVIQFPYNLLDNHTRRNECILAARQAGKTLQARSVYLQGLFFKQADALPAYLAPMGKYLRQINSIAADKGISVYELALSYVLAETNIHEIVIGVDNIEQLQLNLSIAAKNIDRTIPDAVNEIDVVEESLLYPYNWK